MKKLLYFFLLLVLSFHTKAQVQRINTHNSIGWYSVFSTVHINKKISIHGEYHFRRNNFITQWQQSLWRTGLNYHITPQVVARAGYAFAQTYAYGNLALNTFGKKFKEHRIYEMIQLQEKQKRVELIHRFMFEQRFVGSYSNASLNKEDAFRILYRLRYMLRIQIPLKGSEIKDRTPYFGFFNEIFIGFGKNVNANVFDQNRISFLLGYKYNKNVKIELGYLNQILQFGRLVNKQNVFQYNQGFALNCIVNTNLLQQ
jgi:hypothetical protein